MTEPEISSTMLDIRTREFFQQCPPANKITYSVPLYNRHCRKVNLAWYGYMSVDKDISHRYARSFQRKWGMMRSRRFLELWQPLLKAGNSPHPETLIGEREHAMILELIDDVFMLRRCLTGGEIWNGTGPRDDEELALVPVPESIAPYGYMKGDNSPYNVSENKDAIIIDYSTQPFTHILK